MKITHVLPFLKKGGGERIAVDLANQAFKRGHEITIIAAYPVNASELRDSLHSNIDVKYISNVPVPKIKMYLSVLPWVWRNRFWLNQQNIIHCHLTYGEFFGAAICWFRSMFSWSNPVVVETCHSVGMHVPLLLRWLHMRIAERLDAFVLVAEDSHWSNFVKGKPGLLSVVIPNGILFERLTRADSDRQLAYRQKIGIPDECCYVVGTVGRLHRDRKPWMHLFVFSEISKILGGKVHFIVVGDGPELDHMRMLAKKNDIERQVHFTGLSLDPCLPLSVMDLYISLNVGAMTGIAALEAAYLCVPVLAIQMLPCYQMKTEEWIWSSIDLSKVSNKAVGLLQSTLDREKLITKQSAHVRSYYNIEATAISYEVLYQKATQRFHST